MTQKTARIISVILIAIAILASIVLYSYLPERMVSHWNAQGQPDDYMSKVSAVILMPSAMVFLFLLYLAIPSLDPLRKNIEKFRPYFDMFFMGILGFFLYIYGLMLAWNLGYRFSFTYFMIPALAALFYGIGILLEKSERNWFIGIRTPWTLSDDVVWEKTHKLGGKLFKATAFLSLVGLFWPDSAFALALVIVPVIAISIFTIVYSYILYRRRHR